jgi:hypothetical protein
MFFALDALMGRLVAEKGALVLGRFISANGDACRSFKHNFMAAKECAK